MILPRSLLVLATVLLLAGCVTGAGSGGAMVGQVGREPTDEELVQDFLTVALREGGNEDDRSNRGYVTRFHGPVRVRLHGDPGELERQRIEWVVGRMRSVTGHDIAFAAPNEPANYHVHMPGTSSAEAIAGQVFDNIPSLQGTLEKEARLEAKVTFLTAHLARQGGWICTGHLHLGKGRPDLESVHAVVSRGLDARRRNICIVEEMLQVLGLPGDTRKAWPSRFSDNTWLQDPSDYDWLYLRLLYDREIRAGMTAAQVRPIALQRVREWRANGRQLAVNPNPLPFDPAAYAPSNELLLDKFMAWAFSKDSSSYLHAPVLQPYSAPPALSKWPHEMRILLTGQRDRLEGDFAHHTSQIMSVSGLTIKRAAPGEQNVHIHVESDWRPEPIHNAFISVIGGKLKSDALAKNRELIFQDKVSFLKRSPVKALPIRLRSSKDRYYYFLGVRSGSRSEGVCYMDSYYQVLGGGWLHEAPWPSRIPKLSSPCSSEASVYDLLFIRIVYDEKMRSGMPESEALSVARQILSELRPDESRPPELERLIHPEWKRRQAQASQTSRYSDTRAAVAPRQ